MGFKEIKVQEEVAPNLVPMIDIMFLMLLFFMLNADMSRRELEDVVPPIANQAEEDKSDENNDRITVNVFHAIPECPTYAAQQVCSDDDHWAISLLGQHYRLDKTGLDDLQKKLSALADTKRINPSDRTSVSERHVLIRADRFAPYGYIQRSLERAAGAGLYKTEVAAQIEKASIKK